MPSPQTLIHLSDLHVGKRATETLRARQLIEWIGCHHAGAPVLVTGDITESGRRSQCLKAAELLGALARTNPVLTVPGNHDYGFHGIHFQQRCWRNYYRHLAAPLGRWPSGAAGSWLNPSAVTGLGVVVDGGMAYFGLDSCDPEDRELCARGYISRRLADLLTMELKKPAYRRKTRVVLLHHHPFSGSFLTALRGTRRLIRAARDNCELLLFGHHHRFGIWWQRNGVPLTLGSHKSTSHFVQDLLGVGIVQVDRPGAPSRDLDHRIAAIEHPWHIAA